jgi:hypothetical protein
VVDHVLEHLDLSLTCLKLLVSHHKLSLKVVDVVLHKGQLVLGVLELGAGAVRGIGLEVMVVVGPHHLVIQLLVVHLEDVVLLE